MKRAASVAFLLACIVVSGAGFYNVFADNAEVRKAAADVACKEKKCGVGGASMTREDRSPIAQTFLYATAGGSIGIRCTRAALFVGAYSCAKD